MCKNEQKVRPTTSFSSFKNIHTALDVPKNIHTGSPAMDVLVRGKWKSDTGRVKRSVKIVGVQKVIRNVCVWF